jgi:hypothetical protein
MQVGLTREELLMIIASHAEDLSSLIGRSGALRPHMRDGADEEVSDKQIDVAVSRLSALTAELFRRASLGDINSAGQNAAQNTAFAEAQ